MMQVEIRSPLPWFLPDGILGKWFGTRRTGWQFVASAIGPHGYYTAATSPPWEYLRKGETMHTVLVRQLAEDGWDHIPSAPAEWFNLHFRRRVT